MCDMPFAIRHLRLAIGQLQFAICHLGFATRPLPFDIFDFPTCDLGWWVAGRVGGWLAGSLVRWLGCGIGRCGLVGGKKEEEGVNQ